MDVRRGGTCHYVGHCLLMAVMQRYISHKDIQLQRTDRILLDPDRPLQHLQLQQLQLQRLRRR